MARIRTIKPEFWRDQQMSMLSDFTRLVAIALLNIADDEGYFEADPRLIRGDAFPFEENSCRVTVALRELCGIGYCTVRDHSSKGTVGHIRSFTKHQVINKPTRSKLRQIFESAVEIHEEIKENAVAGASDSMTPVVLPENSRLEREQGKGSGKGTGDMEKECCSEVGKRPAEPEVPDPPWRPEDCQFPEFPCAGPLAQRPTWTASQRQLDDWRSAYPDVDIDQHHRRAHVWIMSHLKKRKTKSGMPVYLSGWFAKEQDKNSKKAGAPLLTFAQQRTENTISAINKWRPPERKETSNEFRD